MAELNRTNDDSLCPRLLALDWGTSSLRAFLLGVDGELLQMRTSPRGLQALALPGAAGFEAAFAEIAGEWLAKWPHLPTVASGMVGSLQGWKEAPYVRCPANVASLAEQSACVASGLGGEVIIAPGVLLDEKDAAPDVIRGEEIQIVGALMQRPELVARSTLVMPGTHSKWVQVEHGKITRFSTYMTGELFAVLRQHSILGRLMSDELTPDKGALSDAFNQGLKLAQEALPGDFAHQIFSARTLGLTGRLARNVLKEFLSGLLIGQEIVSGLARSALSTQSPLMLISEAALGKRYADAFSFLGIPVAGVIENPAPRGLWEFARTRGLLSK